MRGRPFLSVLLALILLALAGYLYITWQLGPYGPGGEAYFPKGSSLHQIALGLKEKGIIRSPRVFEGLARWKGVANKLQAGEYRFEAASTPAQVLDKLVKGDHILRKLVIPEGYTFQQIAAAVQAAGIAPAAEFVKSFRSPTWLGKLGFPAESLEGFLFPATYLYDPATTTESLLDQMIANFKKNFDTSLRERALQTGWSLPQVVTLASIIEKETGKASERPVIASVFHNRLKIGMPLQSDPTVIYGLKNFDGNIRKADLSNPHPYNTYVHVGLPPGPIASPGKDSIKAVLYPATTNYLFFVAKGDGSHVFATTLEEHQANVTRYQLGGKTPTPTASPHPLASPGKEDVVPKATPVPSPKPVYDRPTMKPNPWPR